MERLSYSRWRKEVFKWIPRNGRILEVGVGTGKNLSYYYTDQAIHAIDIRKNMLKPAKNRAEKSKAIIHLIQMDVDGIGFPDEIFDTVISTYVFCSVENHMRGLEEIRRVLKPNRLAQGKR